jgi:predicted dehydrogenase
MSSIHPINRREFMAGAAAAAAFTIVPRRVLGGPGQTPPSQKLNIAAVGVGGMGSGDVRSCAGENIVALCDADQRSVVRNAKDFPSARQYSDFRKMLQEMDKQIDAVLVATPDHNHAVVSIMAMKMGKHVHCQKPLAHSPHECRQMGKVAKEMKVATQMGNFGQAGDGPRVVAEYIAAGAIGTVREVHAWTNRYPPISPRGIARPKDTPPVPPGLDWDLWVGPAPMRPYHPCYHAFAWRGWWDFGTGCLGDIGCHELSQTFKALKLGHPTAVEACSSNHQMPPEVANETAPVSSITRWYFPAEGERGPVTVTWWDGGLKPPRPEELEPEREWCEGDGCMIVGDKGKILGHRLIPETKAKEFGKPPQKLERSPGHWKEWFDACRGGKPAGSNFPDHAAHLAEVVMLGNIAIRTKQKLLWDGENFKFTNSADANKLLFPPFRDGWSL